MERFVSMQWSSSVDDLPEAVPITESSFSNDDFDVDKFVTEHSQFQSLGDTLAAVSAWENTFAENLQSVVNDEFAPALKGASAIGSACGHVEDSQVGLKKFVRGLDMVNDDLARAHTALNKELQVHHDLCLVEANARKLEWLFGLLAELEHVLPDIVLNDETSELQGDSTNAGDNSSIQTSAESLVLLAKSYVALAVACKDLKTVRAVQLLAVSVDQLYEMVLEKLNTALKIYTAKDKLELLEAREWVVSQHRTGA